jgi:hypothetical protein
MAKKWAQSTNEGLVLSLWNGAPNKDEQGWFQVSARWQGQLDAVVFRCPPSYVPEFRSVGKLLGAMADSYSANEAFAHTRQYGDEMPPDRIVGWHHFVRDRPEGLGPSIAISSTMTGFVLSPSLGRVPETASEAAAHVKLILPVLPSLRPVPDGK